MQNETQESKNADFSSKRTSFDPPPSQTNIVRLKQNAGNWRRPLSKVQPLLKNIRSFRWRKGLENEKKKRFHRVKAWKWLYRDQNLLSYLGRFLAMYLIQVIVFTTSTLRDFIVIKPEWMYTTIVGRLLSEYPLPPPYIKYDKNGWASLDNVERVLATEHIDGKFTVGMAHERGLLIKRQDHAIVPVKLAKARPAHVWREAAKESPVLRVNVGRRLVGKRKAGLSSAMFPLFQAHMHDLFKRMHGIELPLWKNGLHIALSANGMAEAIIQANEEHLWIDVIVRSDTDSKDGGCDLLHGLVREVLGKADELSPGSQLEKCYLSPRDLARLSADGSTDTTVCVSYSEAIVQKALKSNGFVDNERTSLPEKVEELLLSPDEAAGELHSFIYLPRKVYPLHYYWVCFWSNSQHSPSWCLSWHPR